MALTVALVACSIMCWTLITRATHHLSGCQQVESCLPFGVGYGFQSSYYRVISFSVCPYDSTYHPVGADGGLSLLLSDESSSWPSQGLAQCPSKDTLVMQCPLCPWLACHTVIDP